MCGGVGFKFSDLPKRKLKDFFTEKEIARFEKTGQAYSFFWNDRPTLPVKIQGKIDLVEWGNKNPNLKLPKTGWAKIESVVAGKWMYLKPVSVIIPVQRGYEKGVWFAVHGKGLEGLLIDQKGEKRVYMMTKEATEAYQKLTKHDREPVEAT